MAKGNDNDTRQESDDVKQSFAWGQLFAGSLIGGLAVWKLLHKITNTEPSEWFAGLSRAYEEVRDFVMTPFSWIHMDLTAGERDVIVLSMICYGSMFRAKGHATTGLVAFMWGIGILPFWFILSDQIFPSLYSGFLVEKFWNIRFVFLLTLELALLALLSGTMMRGWDKHPFDMRYEAFQRLVLYNFVFTIGWGTILLLLNWATS